MQASVFIVCLISISFVFNVCLMSGFLVFSLGAVGCFCIGSRLVIPTLYRILLCRFAVLACSVCFRLLVVFAVCAGGLLFHAVPLVVSSFTICRGIVVVYVWDFKWVVCLVDVVSD